MTWEAFLDALAAVVLGVALALLILAWGAA